MRLFDHSVKCLQRFFQVDVSYFLKGGFWLAFGLGGVALIRLLQMSFLAHFVDKAFYGQFQFVMTVIFVLFISGLIGMETALMQSVARGHWSSLVYGVRTKFRWAWLGSLAMLLLSGYFYLTGNELWLVFIPVALLFPWYCSFNVLVSYFMGRENFSKAAFVNISLAFMTFVGVLSVLFVKSLAVMFTCFMVLVVLAQFVIYFSARREAVKTPADSELASYAKHLTFMNSLNYLTPYVDRLFIVLLAGFEGLAVYTVTMAIPVYVTATGNFSMVLLLPKMSRPKPHHVMLLKRWIGVLVLIVAIVACAIALLFPWLIPFLFSEKYADAVVYAQLALAYVIFFVPTSVLKSFFVGRKAVRILYAYNIFIGVSNLVLLTIFVPLFGILGAVLSKVFLGFVGFAFMLLMFLITAKVKSSS